MSATTDRLILWVGEKHSGKTTALADFVENARTEGFKIAGILAPSIYHNSRLMGFDVLDLRDAARAPLARREICGDTVGHFTFLDEGLRLGNAALSKEATESADLIVVDEFGPLELSGRGWRSSVDSLLDSSNHTVMLVVRRQLVDSVRRTYSGFQCRSVDAGEPGAYHKVITMLTRSIHG
jgi:nucleoside-triphosphatase THEP1